MPTVRQEMTKGLIRKDTFTAAGESIDTSSVMVRVTRVLSVTCKLDGAPVSSEYLTISLNALAGTTYDTILYSADLSTDSVTDLFWQPDSDLYMHIGDALDVAFANSDQATWALEVTLEEEQ